MNCVSYFHIYINLNALTIKYIVCVLKGVSVLLLELSVPRKVISTYVNQHVYILVSVEYF